MAHFINNTHRRWLAAVIYFEILDIVLHGEGEKSDSAKILLVTWHTFEFRVLFIAQGLDRLLFRTKKYLQLFIFYSIRHIIY
jgi:hypothetical protein